MQCFSCRTENADSSDNCIACGRGLYALTRGAVLSRRYEIVDAIGKGGMGVVYKARDIDLDEIVAVKVMRGDLNGSSEMSRRFRSEIKLARKITHPNVCRIHDYSRQGHLTYIVMEFIAGVDLKEELRRRGRFDPVEALDLILQVAQGLNAVHSRGVVHRDLKTPNIMRTFDGTAKLMDFGIAKSFASEAGAGETATGLIVGTPEYMSPEQARAEPVDARSDIYSLGIVLFELLTGNLPFRGDTPLATLLKQMHEPPPLNGPLAARIPAVVMPVVRRSLAKSAADRPETVREIVTELERARAQLALASPPTAELTAPLYGPGRRTGAARAPLPLAPAAGAPMPLPTPVPTVAPTAVPTSPRAAATERTTPSTPRPIADSATPNRGQRSLPTPSRNSGGAAKPTPRVHGGWAVVLLALGGGAWLLAHLTRSNPGPTSLPSGSSPGAAAGAAIPSSSLAPTSLTPSTPPPAKEALKAAISGAPSSPSAAASGTLTHARTAPPVRLPYRSAPPRATTEAPGPVAPSVVPQPILPATTPPAPLEGSGKVGPSEPSMGEEAPGTLRIGVKPYAEVIIDGKSLGSTPLGELTLAPGSHTIRLVHVSYQPLQRKITVHSGQTTKLFVDLTLDGVPR